MALPSYGQTVTDYSSPFFAQTTPQAPPAGPARTATLPPGWTFFIDPATRQQCYRNTVTGEISLTPPAAPAPNPFATGAVAPPQSHGYPQTVVTPNAGAQLQATRSPYAQTYAAQVDRFGAPGGGGGGGGYGSSASSADESSSSSCGDEHVRGEHAALDIPYCTSIKHLSDYYGLSIQLYYDFVRFIAITNLVLAILALISFIPHLGIRLEEDIDFSLYQSLFISSYDKSLFGTWILTGILSILVWFSFGPLYALRISCFMKGREIDFEDELENDVLAKNIRVSKSSKTKRKVASYLIFLLCLLVGGAINFGLSLAKSKIPDDENAIRTLLAAVISILIACMNVLWKKVSTKLTEFERHQTISGRDRHITLKFFFFKMFNIVFLYIGAFIAENNLAEADYCRAGSEGNCGNRGGSFDLSFRPSDAVVQASTQCVFETIGEQFFMIMVLDVTMANIIEMGIPMVKNCRAKSKGQESMGANDQSKPDFNLAEEYLELLYRQYIIYMGSMTFPMITMVGFLGNILEFFLDKYRMLYICRKRPKVDAHMKKFLTFFLVVSALFSIFTFPYGAMWVLGAKSFGPLELSNCEFFAG